MSEEFNKEIVDMTSEEKAEAWAKWVRSEVNAALNIYLSKADSSNINIRYFPRVVEELESGVTLDETKATGVLISIELIFGEPIDLNSPITS